MLSWHALIIFRIFIIETKLDFVSFYDKYLQRQQKFVAERDFPILRVPKYAKFGIFYTKIFQMTPLKLRRESLRLQKFSVTNREPLRLQKFSVTNTVLSLPFLQQIQFTLIVNVVNLT